MKKMLYAAFAVLVLGLMASVWQPGFAQDKAAKGRALKVKLHYTGSGTVDERHKILTFLFESPEFVRGQKQRKAKRNIDVLLNRGNGQPDFMPRRKLWQSAFQGRPRTREPMN